MVWSDVAWRKNDENAETRERRPGQMEGALGCVKNRTLAKEVLIVREASVAA